MTIDPTKICVGDEVTVRTKAFNTFNDGSLMLSNGFIRVYDYIPVENILSHTPAPRPFVVGGKVRPIGDYYIRATFVAQHNDALWIVSSEGFNKIVNARDYEPCE